MSVPFTYSTAISDLSILLIEGNWYMGRLVSKSEILYNKLETTKIPINKGIIELNMIKYDSHDAKYLVV